MNAEGLLIVVSGPSGAGKGTIRQALQACRGDLLFLPSATTRPPRAGEVDGVNYFFVSRDEFATRMSQGEFLEWADVYGNWYGTPKAPVLEALRHGRDVLLEKDIKGALALKRVFPEAVYVFVFPPSLEELKARMARRGTEKAEAMRRRLAEAREELAHVGDYDYVIINDDLEAAVEKLLAIIVAEKCKVSRQFNPLVRSFLEKGVKAADVHDSPIP